MKIAILTCLLFAQLLTTAAFAQEKPNIVYILVDNWGWGDISVQGSTVSTPRIDAFAAEGLRLTNFNVQNQCIPTELYDIPAKAMLDSRSTGEFGKLTFFGQ